MTNLNPQQPLIGMIFTNADPRYAGRFDDKQGGDTIVRMERVREAIECGVGGRVNMVVEHIRANGLSLQTDRRGGERGESRELRLQPKGT